MPRSAVVLALALALPGPALLRAQAHPRDIVRSLTNALDAGRGDSTRRAVELRVRRAPTDAAAQFGLATLDRLTWRHAAAEARFVAIARTAPPRWRVWATLGQGMSQTQRWDSAGVPVVWRALALADSLGEPDAAATALLTQARYLGRFLRADSLTRMTARARRLVPAADSGLTASALCADAGAALRNRALPSADSLAQRGAALAAAARDRRARGRCLLTLAQISEAKGTQLVAWNFIRDAEGAIDSTADTDFSASVHQYRAYHDGQYSYGLADARAHALLAIARGAQSGNRLAVGYARLNLAQLAVRLGDFRAAGRQLDSAAVVMAALGDRPGLAARDFVTGDAAFALGRHVEAQSAYRSSMARYRALGNPVLQVSLRLAMLALERGELSPADSLLKDIAADAARFNLVGVQKDLIYYEALLALKGGRPLDAAAGFRRYRTGTLPAAALYRLDAGLREAEALAIAGKLAEAEAVADSAFPMLERMRLKLTESPDQEGGGRNRDVLMGLASTRRFEFDPDLGLATLVNRLATGGRVTGAFQLADAERARTLWVQMTRRGILGRDSAALGPRGRITFPADMPVDALRQALDPGTAILEFTGGAGGEPSTLFVVWRDQLRAITLPTVDSLATPTQRFTELIEGGAYPRALARSLGRALLDSALSVLPASVNRLIVVPHGPLYRLPFDALVLASGRPLVERFAVSIAPSARLAVDWLASPGPGSPGRVVAFGDPRFAPDAGLPRLTGSAREAGIAAGPRGLLRLGRDASEAALKQADWNGVSVLHLATHARTEDWGVLTSAVHLAPGGTEDGRLRPEEIAMGSIRVELVVLSGCRTTGGVVVFGEGIQGLVTPFLEAGARAVVATYWEVGDVRIIPIVERFYAELRRGSTAGEALRAAKRWSISAGQPPALWAAFGLTGNPDVRPLGPATGR